MINEPTVPTVGVNDAVPAPVALQSFPAITAVQWLPHCFDWFACFDYCE